MEGLIIADFQAKIVEANQAALRLFGYKYEELKGKTGLDLIDPEDLKRQPFTIDTALAGEAIRLERVFVRKDGSRFSGDISVASFLDQHLVVIVRDTSERKEFEIRLRNNQSLLDKSQELGHVGSWEYDLVADKLYWSDETYRIFGIEPDANKMSYEYFLEMVHPEDRSAVDLAYNRSLSENKSRYDIEHRIINQRTGNIRYVHQKCEHEKDEDRDVVKSIGMIQDISERKRIENALRTAERRLAEAERIAHLGSWQLDIATGKAWWSDEFFRICGYEPGEFEPSADRGLSIIHPDDREMASQILQRAINEDETYDIEKRIMLPDGSVKWVHSLGMVVRGESDDNPKLIGSFLDITKRRQAEEALKKNLARYRALFENAAEGVILHDIEGNIHDANDAALSMFGYSWEEIVKLHPFQLVHPDEADVVHLEFDSIQKNEVSHAEHRCLRKDGEEFIATIRGKKVAENLIQGVLLDVTVQRQQEERLRLLNRAIEHSAESIVITDSDGLIRYVNPAFTAVTGYNFQEVFMQNPRILKSGQQPIEFYKDLWETITQGKIWQGEFLNAKKNGEHLWEEAIISPVLNQEHKITHYVAAKKDITLRKNFEEHKADVERILRHDLKSPLSGIIGIPQHLVEEQNLTDEQKEFLMMIEKAGQKMLSMIDFSLDLFKIETGQYTCKPFSVDVVKIVNRLITQNRAVLSENQLGFRMEYNSSPLAKGQVFSIPSEEHLLNTLLSNLFKNAIEASPNGEMIRFNFIDEYEFQKIIHIENKGVVPQKIRDNFFDKYVTHGKSNGTGIGTYSAKLMAEAMGYKLEMNTSDNENTTCLSIYIPVNI